MLKIAPAIYMWYKKNKMHEGFVKKKTDILNDVLTEFSQKSQKMSN